MTRHTQTNLLLIEDDLRFPPKYVPLGAVFIVILWQRPSDPVDRKPGRLADIFRLAQHLPKRQPGAQAGSRAKNEVPPDVDEHRAGLEQPADQPEIFELFYSKFQYELSQNA